MRTRALAIRRLPHRHTEPAPLLTIVALLVAFGAASVALWAWFRFRPSGPSAQVAVS
jgi:hypothetical protein